VAGAGAAAAHRVGRRLRAELIARHGESGAFPSPQTLARLDLDLPGRKSEYLRAVAKAALDGLLDGGGTARSRPGEATTWLEILMGTGF
jgi:DNA-3-methyladenine glycosylase II